MLNYSHKAITVHKEGGGGGGYSDTVRYMRRLGAFFCLNFLNYIILFFFFGGGGGGVRNINIFGGMKILWIFLGVTTKLD